MLPEWPAGRKGDGMKHKWKVQSTSIQSDVEAILGKLENSGYEIVSVSPWHEIEKGTGQPTMAVLIVAKKERR